MYLPLAELNNDCSATADRAVRPETHDMPGVVSPEDREQALRDYPDPRLVLGPIY